MRIQRIIAFIYYSKPNPLVDMGGVRHFLSYFFDYVQSQEIECEYCVMSEKNLDFKSLSPIINLFLTFKLLLTLFSFSFRNRKKQRIFYVHSASYDGIAALIVCKIFHIPLVLHFHNSPSSCYLATKSFFGVFEKIAYTLIHLTEKVVLENSTKIIVTNLMLKKYVSSIGIPEQAVSILPMAVNKQKIQQNIQNKRKLREELGIPDTNFVIGYIGRLSPEKNIEVLIKAFSLFVKDNILANAQLIIVGEGSEKERLQQFATSLKTNEYIKFTGYKNDVSIFLSVFDIFVLPSKTEGSPISLLEAITSGKLIVASNIPAVTEIITDGEDGLLFNPNDVNQLEEIIQRIYDDPLSYEPLCDKVKKKAEQYEDKTILPKLYKIITSTN